VTAALVVAVASFAAIGPIGTNAGFEDNDANLVVDGATFDWNGFAPIPIGTATGTDTGKWNGTAPTRRATKLTSGWNLSAFEDYQATNSDDGFAGGTKQDDDCAKIITSKAPNKDDLKRIYIANKTVPVTTGTVTSNHIFLELGFVRIPLNSTQSSTHIGFEFNEKRAGACGATSAGLVKRTPQGWGGTPTPGHSGGDQSNPGDLLIVYDYEGSTTSPTLTYRQWIDANSTVASTCEISNDNPPCWSPAKPLTAAGYAEAQVNFGANNVPGAGIADDLAPGGTETLGLKEFGEAGIDLTAAGIFGSSTCLGFGQAEAVSRSSGNSGNAAMEDVSGGPVNINNCGTITIIKHTSPRGRNQAFTYTSNLHPNSGAGGVSSGVGATGAFSLNDTANTTGDSTANTVSESDLQAGTYTVTEGSDPAGFAFNNVTCDSTHAATTAGSKLVTISLVANDNITCTYVNDQQLGAIRIKKTSSKAAATALSGAHFRICTNGSDGGAFTTCTAAKTGSDDLGPTDSNGFVCLSGLAFGDYYVSEKSAPTGYARDDLTLHKVTVDTNTDCTDTLAHAYDGEALTFTDTPLTDLTLTVSSEVSGGTKSAVKCLNSSNAHIGNSPKPTNVNFADTSTYGDPVTVQADPTHGAALTPGTYVCTVVVDP
jgi:hypothetical protein